MTISFPLFDLHGTELTIGDRVKCYYTRHQLSPTDDPDIFTAGRQLPITAGAEAFTGRLVWCSETLELRVAIQSHRDPTQLSASAKAAGLYFLKI